MAVIFEMEEEIFSAESDEEEEKKELDEDDKILKEVMKSMEASPNASPFDWIENIIAADDQLINLEVLKSKLTEIGVQEKVTYCVNGQDTIDQAKRIIQASVSKAQMGTTIKPINFLLLDFQMPQKNGVQVLKEIRTFYGYQQMNDNDVKIEEPVFVFLTAFMTPAFKKHLADLGVQHIYEKPI